MGEVVNLRQARKRKKRAEKEVDAAESRVIHGRSAAERIIKQRAEALAAKHLDGHRREPDEAE